MDKIIKFNQRGKSAAWVVAIEASRVVGHGKRGDTREVAKALSRSVDTIEKLARAGRMYISFRAMFPTNENYRYLAVARKVLSIKHFAVLGRYYENAQDSFFPMTDEEAMNYLFNATHLRDSAATLEARLRVHHVKNIPEWGVVAKSIANKLPGLINSIGVPEEVRWAAKMLLEFIKDAK